MTLSLRAAMLAAAGFLSGLLCTVPLAQADDLVVEYDQAHLLALDEPATNIIIGNPSIADVTLKSTKLLVITGKTFGVTNLIVLNADDKIILSTRMMVKANDHKVVTLTKAGASATYNCVPYCEPLLKVGDEAKHYLDIAQSSQQKMKISEGSSDAPQSNN